MRIRWGFDSRVRSSSVNSHESWIHPKLKITTRDTFSAYAGAQIHAGPCHKKRVLYKLTPLDCMIVYCILYVLYGIFYVWFRLDDRSHLEIYNDTHTVYMFVPRILDHLIF